MFLGVLFAAISNITGLEFFNIMSLIPLAYVFWLTLLFIAYAWVINPLKELKERRKNKDK